METLSVTPKKARCKHCKKKLKIIELTMVCKCKEQFCITHLSPHSHNCTFDYLGERRKLIRELNPKMSIKSIEVK